VGDGCMPTKLLKAGLMVQFFLLHLSFTRETSATDLWSWTHQNPHDSLLNARQRMDSSWAGLK
jgi:hypothetical protein